MWTRAEIYLGSYIYYHSSPNIYFHCLCWLSKTDCYITNSDVHTCNTRFNLDLNMMIFQKCGWYSSIKLYNYLPPSLKRLSHDIPKLKAALKSFLSPILFILLKSPIAGIKILTPHIYLNKHHCLLLIGCNRLWTGIWYEIRYTEKKIKWIVVVLVYYTLWTKILYDYSMDVDDYLIMYVILYVTWYMECIVVQ
jgi:hypothetical protein